MPASTSTRLTDKAKLWVTRALKADYAVSNEHVIWDASVVVFPDYAATEDTQGSSSADLPELVQLPAVVIYLEIPGVTPEAPLYISPILAPFSLDEKRVTLAVDNALKSMRDLRLKQKAKLDKPVSD